MNDFQITDNFNLREFSCKGADCCHGIVKIDSRLVKILQVLRDHIGTPIYIVSGYRCKEHNTAVGGAPRSQHMDGRAADIAGDFDLEYVAELAGRMGISGIGIYKASGFVHLDTRDGNLVKWEG